MLTLDRDLAIAIAQRPYEVINENNKVYIRTPLFPIPEYCGQSIKPVKNFNITEEIVVWEE